MTTSVAKKQKTPFTEKSVCAAGRAVGFGLNIFTLPGCQGLVRLTSSISRTGG